MSIQSDRFVAERAPFLEYLQGLEASWPVVSLDELIEKAGGPDRVAVLGVDLVEGFCRQGALSSPRVTPVVGPAVRILTHPQAPLVSATVTRSFSISVARTVLEVLPSSRTLSCSVVTRSTVPFS
mgnify:CR=1 FL=1